jgi:hypothetical protein
LGSTDTIFGTAATFPNRITIANNHMREIGIFGKQTSESTYLLALPHDLATWPFEQCSSHVYVCMYV